MSGSREKLFKLLIEAMAAESLELDVPRYRQRIFNVRLPEHVHSNITKTQKNFGISSKDKLIELLFSKAHVSR